MNLFNRNVKLGAQPRKLARDLTLLQNEKCIVKVSAGGLAVPILVDNVERGQVFTGKGQLTLDAIVETSRGAVGKPLIKELHKPFLFFGETVNLQEGTVQATSQDISDMGYSSLEDFVENSNGVLGQFIGRGHGRFDEGRDSRLFAFLNEHGKWDLLISRDNELVYTSAGKVFISRDKADTVMINPPQVMVANKGKTVVIDGNSILVDRGDSAEGGGRG